MGADLVICTYSPSARNMGGQVYLWGSLNSQPACLGSELQANERPYLKKEKKKNGQPLRNGIRGCTLSASADICTHTYTHKEVYLVPYKMASQVRVPWVVQGQLLCLLHANERCPSAKGSYFQF